MPPNASSGSLRQHQSLSTDHWSGTPQDSPNITPNTRKRQRLNYAQLHNKDRSTTPTPAVTSPRPSAITSRYPASTAHIQPPPARARPPSNNNRQPPLFVPAGRQSILQPYITVIQVTDPAKKVFGIAKHK
jgi:hypothetical protein